MTVANLCPEAVFLNDALLQVTSKSINYAFGNKYQQTF